jgi:type IV secretory pathway VirB10-like protein
MESIIGSIIAILYVVYAIYNAVQSEKNKPKTEPLVIVEERPKKINKQPKRTKQNAAGTPRLQAKPEHVKRQSLRKTLSPQGEGSRFDAAPGTLDTSALVTPSVEVTVNPQLGSLTDIYEQAQTYNDSVSGTADAAGLQRFLTSVDDIRSAVILAEIFGPPKANSNALNPL